MKKITIIFSLFFAGFILTSCEIEGINTDATVKVGASENINKIFDISTDNTGTVKITPTGEGASKFVVLYGHGTGANSSAVVAPGQNTVHIYPEGSYTVTIKAYDIAGNETVKTYPLNVTYVAPVNLTVNTDFQSYTLNLTTSAKYAMGGFLVYFGDVPNEVGTRVAGTLNSSGVVEGTAISHTYASAGTYTLKVVALSGGVATTISTQTVHVYDPFTLPITYENANQNYSIGGTFGGVDVAVVANPFPGGSNTSAHVWKFTKNAGASSWAGTWTPLATPNATPINMNNGKKFKVMVYATEAGKALHFQLEQASTNIDNQSVDVTIPIANQWVELTFDFNSLSIPTGTLFKQLVFQYNLAGDGTGEVIYIDNVTQTN